MPKHLTGDVVCQGYGLDFALFVAKQPTEQSEKIGGANVRKIGALKEKLVYEIHDTNPHLVDQGFHTPNFRLKLFHETRFLSDEQEILRIEGLRGSIIEMLPYSRDEDNVRVKRRCQDGDVKLTPPMYMADRTISVQGKGGNAASFRESFHNVPATEATLIFDAYGAGVSFEVQYTTDARPSAHTRPTWHDVDPDAMDIPGSSALVYLCVKKLKPETEYKMRVRAVKGTKKSKWSQHDGVIVTAAAPARAAPARPAVVVRPAPAPARRTVVALMRPRMGPAPAAPPPPAPPPPQLPPAAAAPAVAVPQPAVGAAVGQEDISRAEKLDRVLAALDVEQQAVGKNLKETVDLICQETGLENNGAPFPMIDKVYSELKGMRMVQ